MADKYQNKYRIASARASWHGYDGGTYFVTICTKNRAHYFGEIIYCTDAKCTDVKFCFSTDTNTEPIMQLSEIGKCAVECWNAIPTHFPHVELGPFVVMPNHIHGILFINQYNDILGTDANVETQNIASQKNIHTQDIASQKTIIETQDIAFQPITIQTQNITIQTQNIASLQKFGPQSRNLASVIRGFKIGVTKYAHTNNIEFAWQTRFHDRIVRNQEELNRIAQYIEPNIARWTDDKLNKND